MLKIRNISNREIRQLFEGKVYILAPGHELDMEDGLASWFAGHLNDLHRNELRKPDDKAPWIEVVPSDPVEVQEQARGIIRGKPPKAKDDKPKDDKPGEGEKDPKGGKGK